MTRQARKPKTLASKYVCPICGKLSTVSVDRNGDIVGCNYCLSLESLVGIANGNYIKADFVVNISELMGYVKVRRPEEIIEIKKYWDKRNRVDDKFWEYYNNQGYDWQDISKFEAERKKYHIKHNSKL